jgi:hypothetical protein
MGCNNGVEDDNVRPISAGLSDWPGDLNNRPAAQRCLKLAPLNLESRDQGGWRANRKTEHVLANIILQNATRPVPLTFGAMRRQFNARATIQAIGAGQEATGRREGIDNGFVTRRQAGAGDGQDIRDRS